MRKHDQQISIKKNSWFHGININLGESLKAIYLWSVGLSIKQLRREVPIAQKTAIDLYCFLREMCASVTIKNGTPVGGTNPDGSPKIVEIDESKFGRIKYNRVSIV